MGMSETQALLRDIERFIATHKMAPSTFGRKAVNDGKLVSRLRSGGSITLATAADIQKFLAAPQPSPSASEAA